MPTSNANGLSSSSASTAGEDYSGEPEWDPFGMSVNDRSAASRQFVASAPSLSSKMNEFATNMRSIIAVYGLGLGVGLGVGWGLGLGAAVGSFVGLGMGTAILLGWTAYLWWRSRRKILIDVTSDGVTVNQRPRETFSFVDAKLGPWVTMGVVLHLQRGSRRFVLGGRDCRIAPATRLDAPPVPAVDAWLWDAEFDELLAMSGGRTELDIRGPAPGEPTWCSACFPTPCWPNRWARLHSENNDGSSDHSGNRALSLTWTMTRSG